MSKGEASAGLATWQDYFRVLSGILALILGLVILFRAVLLALGGMVVPITFIVGAALLGFAFFRLRVVWSSFSHRG